MRTGGNSTGLSNPTCSIGALYALEKLLDPGELPTPNPSSFTGGIPVLYLSSGLFLQDGSPLGFEVP